MIDMLNEHPSQIIYDGQRKIDFESTIKSTLIGLHIKGPLHYALSNAKSISILSLLRSTEQNSNRFYTLVIVLNYFI